MYVCNDSFGVLCDILMRDVNKVTKSHNVETIRASLAIYHSDRPTLHEHAASGCSSIIISSTIPLAHRTLLHG